MSTRLHEAKLPWYAVPYYGRPSEADVLNSAGEHVAHYERIEDAVLAVNVINAGACGSYKK